MRASLALRHPALSGRLAARADVRSRRACKRLQAVVPVAKAHTVTLILPGDKQAAIKVPDGVTIYEAASRHSLPLPATCMVGSCSSCAAMIVSGKVTCKGQTCITPGLAKEGYVALCCAVPQSDVTVRTHQGPAVRKKRREELTAHQ